jgi:hypothetical protein
MFFSCGAILVPLTQIHNGGFQGGKIRHNTDLTSPVSFLQKKAKEHTMISKKNVPGPSQQPAPPKENERLKNPEELGDDDDDFEEDLDDFDPFEEKDEDFEDTGNSVAGAEPAKN